MHEFGIVEDILATINKIATEQKFKKINRVTIQVGKLRQVIPENLQFAFSVLAENTIAANAQLVIDEIPITIRCQSCNQKATIADFTYICPHCNSSDLEILTGKEIILETIEGEK